MRSEVKDRLTKFFENLLGAPFILEVGVLKE